MYSLKQSLEERQQPDVMKESMQVTPWTDDVLDKVVQMFIRRKTSNLLHKPSKEAEYGFLTGVQEEPTFQSDLAKLANGKQTETSTNEPVEEVDETYDSSDSESHPSDQNQDISGTCNREGIRRIRLAFGILTKSVLQL